ncbi:MAG: hypothetical protein GC179_06655 [Anaerolineaceae bacterium]|nr:hypothetical protein [Anaerolineaceae bacterium]
MLNSRINIQEIRELPNVELSKRTKAALDEFVQALKTGEQISEKGRVYQAYENERIKRLDNTRSKYSHFG